jgi:hypothetical protein
MDTWSTKHKIRIWFILSNIRNILHEIRKRKANWIGHILRRNCLLQRVTEGKIQGGIEMTGRQERRRRKLLDDLKEKRGYSHYKEEALDRTMWRARFGIGFVVRQTAKWMNKVKAKIRFRTCLIFNAAFNICRNLLYFALTKYPIPRRKVLQVFCFSLTL